MTISVMLDLETWGTTPGSDIRSIGACVFDPHDGTVGASKRYETNTQEALCWHSDIWSSITNGNNPYLFYIALDNPVTDAFGIVGLSGRIETLKYPLTRDPRTVQWWSDQSDEARAAFVNPVDLREALGRFSRWIMDLAYPHERGQPVPENEHINPSPDIRLWSHGSHFDAPILAAAYEAVGLPVPWHYRAPRDTRTLFDAAGITDHSALMAAHPGPLGVSHHALDDAICQARAVCAAYAQITVQEQPS